jgi:hypothetical protein
MVIEGAEVDDAVRYTCIARNLAGELEKNFDVNVHGKYRSEFLQRASASLFISVEQFLSWLSTFCCIYSLLL